METTTEIKKLAMCDRLIVMKPFQAGRAIAKVNDRLQLFTSTSVIDGIRCATVQNTRTRTVLTMPIENLKLFCKRIGFDGIEDFA